MKSAVYIDLSIPVNNTYEVVFLSSLKELFPGISTIDLDSESDPALFSYTVQLLNDSEKIVMLLTAQEESSVKNFYRIADHLIKNREKVLVLLEGNNQFLEKLLLPLQDQFLKVSGDQERLTIASAFFKNEQ